MVFPAFLPFLSSRLRASSRLLLSALFATVPLASASAAIRYVGPGGSDSNAGISPTTRWATIAKANGALQPGDVCILQPGTYVDPIQPVRGGTSPSLRITYVGSLANPGLTQVPRIALAQAYVTVKGVKATGSATLAYPARYDSVAWCSFGALDLHAAKFSMVARNTVNGRVNILANDGRACYLGTEFDPGCTANSESDTLRGNKISLGTIPPGEKGFVIRGLTRSCLLDSNRVTGTFDATGSSVVDETFGLICFNISDLVFRDNRWTFEAASAPNGTNTQWEAFRLRDSTRFVTFERDTMLAGLNSYYPVRGLFAASGSFVHSVSDNRWTGCVYKSNSYFYTQDRFTRCVIEQSVFASKGANAVWFQGEFDNSVLRHNTFWSTGQVARFTTFTGPTNEITSNIFYSESAGPGGANGAGQVLFESGAKSNFVSDYNLYYTPSYTSTPGDRSVAWCCWGIGAPGSGLEWNQVTGQEGSSRFGSPLFYDASFASLDTRLRAGSPAFHAALDGSDIGPSSQDATRPARVMDLRGSP